MIAGYMSLLGPSAGAKLGKMSTLSVADRVMLFQAIMPVHRSFCTAGIVISLAPIIYAPSVWFAGVLAALVFVMLMASRWSMAHLEDQERALHLFGLHWLSATITNCITFVIGNSLYGLCTNVPSAAVYTLACMTGLVPMYLQLSGVSAAKRIVNNLIIAATSSSLIIWLALLVGEMVGAHMSSLIMRWIQTPSALRGADSPIASRVLGCDGGKGLSGREPAEPKTVKEMLRCFACQPAFHPDLLLMHWPSLCFKDPTIEALCAANSLRHSSGMHSIAIMAAAVICGTGMVLSPAFRPLGVMAGLWIALIWRTHQRLRGCHDSPLTYVSFSEAYSRLTLLFGMGFLCFSLVTSKEGQHAAETLPGGAPSMRFALDGVYSSPLTTGLGSGLHATTDTAGAICGNLLLMLAGAHQWLVVLPPAHRMINCVIVLVCVVSNHSHRDREGKQLLPPVAHNFILAACVLLMGELIGFSIDHVRRTLFRDWVRNVNAKTPRF
jgi:hypothetical protein